MTVRGFSVGMILALALIGCSDDTESIADGWSSISQTTTTVKRVTTAFSTSTRPTTTTIPPTTIPYNHPTMTLAEFHQLATGMSHAQASQIIGGPGQLLSQSDLGGYSTIMYSWSGEGSLGANANVMFQNGKLISKSQYGLN